MVNSGRGAGRNQITEFLNSSIGNFSICFIKSLNPSISKSVICFKGRCEMRMYDPPTHPGEIIKKLCLEPLGLSVTEAAKALGVSRKTLSSILNGHTGISPEMAIRLSIAFDTTPESWLNQQVQYDLRRAEQSIGELRVRRLSAA